MEFDFTKDIALENDRALLRPIRSDDLKNLLEVACETDNLVRFSPLYIHTPAYLQDFIDTAIIDREKKFRYAFVIYDKLKKQYAGSTSIANLSSKDLRFEIGWTWIGKNFQKTGLNRNCKYLLLEFGFDELQFERIEFKTDERNLASRTAMEKMGAVYEGKLRSHTLMNDGFRRNTVYYSILKNEWEQLKKNFLRTNF